MASSILQKDRVSIKECRWQGVMKDKHGVMRGHCGVANCECQQYRPPPPEFSGGKHLCEYCDHLPGKHQRVVALGPCLGCGVDNCESYEPENDWSYSECQYCGCEASCHKGAEQRKLAVVECRGKNCLLYNYNVSDHCKIWGHARSILPSP